ncbi:hypothetical protein, partial [Leptospira santarosai]
RISLLKWLATALFAPIPSEFRYNRFRICYTELTLTYQEFTTSHLKNTRERSVEVEIIIFITNNDLPKF